MIPQKHREIINKDKYYKKCLLCSNKPEIHHHFQYANCQINEMWNYVPLCTKHHRGNDGVHRSKKTRQYIDLIVLNKMTDEDRQKYYKKDWEQMKRYAKSIKF